MDLTQLRSRTMSHRLIRSNSALTAHRQGPRKHDVSDRSSQDRTPRSPIPPAPASLVDIAPPTTTRASLHVRRREHHREQRIHSPTRRVLPQQQPSDQQRQQQRLFTTTPSARTSRHHPRQYTAHTTKHLRQQPVSPTTRLVSTTTQQQQQCTDDVDDATAQPHEISAQQVSVAEQDSLAEILDPTHAVAFQGKQHHANITNSNRWSTLLPSSNRVHRNVSAGPQRSCQRSASRQHHTQPSIYERNFVTNLSTKDAAADVFVSMMGPPPSTQRTTKVRTKEKPPPTSVVLTDGTNNISSGQQGFHSTTAKGDNEYYLINEDDSSFAYLSQLKQQEAQRPFDEISALFETCSKEEDRDRPYLDGKDGQLQRQREESKYSRFVRRVAVQDETIRQLQPHQQAKAEATRRDGRISLVKERGSTIRELQSQLVNSRNECRTVQSQLAQLQAQVARQLEELEASSSQSFRERFHADDMLRQESAKNKHARDEAIVLRQQMAELQERVEKLQQITVPASLATHNDIFASSIRTQDDARRVRLVDSPKGPFIMAKQPNHWSPGVDRQPELPKPQRFRTRSNNTNTASFAFSNIGIPDRSQTSGDLKDNRER